MLSIEAKHISKKFNQLHIIQNLSYLFNQDKIYGIVGNNGSGKSTLLKIISGFITPNQGEIVYTKNNQVIPVESIYKEISFMAPYIDIIDDFTVSENMKFHFSHKKSYISSESEMLDLMKLPKHKKIRNFSSGMRQKLKLSLSLFTESAVLLLDEPGSFLDIQTKNYFQDLLQTLQNNRMVIIASNEKNDLESCTEIINIEDYK